MGKRKGRQQKNGSTIPVEVGDEMSVDEGGGSKFFACYLLTSMCPRFKGHTYIGFTVNPRRRIRQHNGEVTMGAWRTKRKRPWEMVLCIYGFPTNVSALQFEWAWQHPVESRAVRQAAASFKTLGGVANKIKLAYTMLTLPAWQSLNLTVNFLSTKYKMHSAGCPRLPDHMRVQVCPLDELPCYTGIDINEFINDDWDNSEECERISEELINEGSVESPASNSSAGNQDITEANVDEHIDWIEELGQHAKEIKTASNSFAGNQDSTEENVDEHIDWIEELGERTKEDSATHNDTEQTYIVIGSPVSSSLSSRSFNISDNFKDMYELDDEFGQELPQQPAKVDTYQDPEIKNPLIIKNPGLSREVEVIDLFTPPCYKIADSKKKGLSTACPEIIDLTDSPIFV